MAKKKVKITRADGVRQSYHVGSDVVAPTAAPQIVYADEFPGAGGAVGSYEGVQTAYERFQAQKAATVTVDPKKAAYPIGSVHKPSEEVERDLPRGTMVVDTEKDWEGNIKHSVWMKSGYQEGWAQLAAKLPVDADGQPIINEDLRTQIHEFADSALYFGSKDVTSLARSGSAWKIYDFAESQ